MTQGADAEPTTREATPPAEGQAKRGTFKAALAYPEFRLIAAALAVSSSGNWLYNVALLVYVFDRTGSAGWVAAATIVRLAPMIIFSPFGGALADRYDKRLVMITSDLSRAALMGGLTVTAWSSVSPAVGLAIAFAATALGTPFEPAVGATTPSLVAERDLAAANAVIRTIANTALVAGPAIGGLLLVVASPAIAFLFNGVSFLFSALLVSMVRPRSAAVEVDARVGLLKAVGDGVRAMRAARGGVALPAFMMGASFIYGAETVLLLLLSERQLGTGSNGIGYLIAAIGFGGVVSAGITTRLVEARNPAVPLAGALLAMGLPLALLPPVHVAAVAVVIMTIQGTGLVIVDVLVLTLLQRTMPPQVVGGVLGIVDSLVIMTTLLGSLLAPVLAQLLGLTPALVIIGAGVPVVAILSLLRLGGLAEAAPRPDLAPTVDMLARLDIFAAAPRPSLERLAAASTTEDVPAGKAVVRQGDPATGFFVVRSGVLDVISTGERGMAPVVVNSLGPGDYFGEIGLIEGVPRTASVVARREASVLRISGSDFLDSLNQSPSASRLLFEGVDVRMSRTHPSRARAPRTLEGT